jgi:Uma2 family endonuclease
VAVLPRARRFSVDEFERMVEARVFTSDDRLELIDGEIIEMAPIGDPHASVVDRLTMLMARRVGDRAIVRIQGPIRFRSFRSRPQPDLALLEPRPDYYAAGAPGAVDIFLLVEVMDSSVEYDRRTKAPLYARAGIWELWLVDIPAGVVEVHRQSSASGSYHDVHILHRGETLTPLAFPDIALTVDEILG